MDNTREYTKAERLAIYVAHLEEKIEKLDRMAAEARHYGKLETASMCTDYRIEIQHELAQARFMEDN